MPSADSYYPPPAAAGDWRWLPPDDVREIAGIDAEQLERVFALQRHLFGSFAWGAVVIRHGWLVCERYSFMSQPTSRFDIWSCTKSFTSTAWGMLLHDDGAPAGIHLDSPAYDLLPAGQPLTDPRKRQITIRHLLTMTSGIPGEGAGIFGVTPATGDGAFEQAFGFHENRYGQSAATLAAAPGQHWDYSDPAFAHLSPLFAAVTDAEIRDFMRERLFQPIGITEASWDLLGGGGFLGPHTCPHVGLHISARELARFGYLLLRGGEWKGAQLIPPAWLDLATRPSQAHNPAYGYGFWVNSDGARWRHLPTDLFALEGYNANRCYIIPSLDLVVARTGAGPPQWNEGDFIGGIVAAIAS